MGRHRAHFDSLICENTKANSVSWLDFNFGTERKRRDLELKGIDFIDNVDIKKKWESFWPQTGNVQNWDAVGFLRFDHNQEWVLVEAKSHLREARSDCRAKARGGLNRIKAALNQTKRYLNVPEEVDWLHGYYQYCNRLATLFFLLDNHIMAHLLFIFFINDSVAGQVTPQSASEWQKEIKARDAKVGIREKHPFNGRVHHIFLDVLGGDQKEYSVDG